MSRHSKVSWQEGMFLLPQHFQQADRHQETMLNLRLRAGSALSWGVMQLQIDEDALRQGVLALTRCQAIFPDGLPVDAPEVDALPPPRGFHLDAGKRGLEVFLTVPLPRLNLPLVTKDRQRGDIRYIEHIHEISDDQDPEQRQALELAEKNLRLVVGGEPLDGLSAIRIAELQRNADGIIGLRPDYIAPCPQAAAAPALQRLLRELLAALSARASSMAEERRQRGYALQPSAEDMQSFWFLHALNSHAPVLRHLYELPGAHPAQLFEELLRLCGSLGTFDPKLSANLDHPLYDHQDLQGCFSKLDKRLRALLSRLFVTRYEIIPLTRADIFWKGVIADSQLLARGDLLLVATGLPPTLIATFPNACKIAEYSRIETVMGTFVSEVTITPVSTPPPTVPVRQESCYFRIDRASKGFDAILKTGQIAAFVAGSKNLPELRLELIGIRPEQGGGPL